VKIDSAQVYQLRYLVPVQNTLDLQTSGTLDSLNQRSDSLGKFSHRPSLVERPRLISPFCQAHYFSAHLDSNEKILKNRSRLSCTGLSQIIMELLRVRIFRKAKKHDKNIQRHRQARKLQTQHSLRL